MDDGRNIDSNKTRNGGSLMLENDAKTVIQSFLVNIEYIPEDQAKKLADKFIVNNLDLIPSIPQDVHSLSRDTVDKIKKFLNYEFEATVINDYLKLVGAEDSASTGYPSSEGEKITEQSRIESLKIRDKECIRYDISSFSGMSENCYTRPSQIPIVLDRFIYLTMQYMDQGSSDWVLVKNIGHFIIYNKQLKTCVFDAKYKVFNTDIQHEKDIVAVIVSMCINSDAIAKLCVDDDFGLLADLLTKLL